MNRFVSIIVDPDFDSRKVSLEQMRPFWIVRSPQNEQLNRSFVPDDSGTMFKSRFENDRQRGLLDVLNDVHDHFG